MRASYTGEIIDVMGRHQPWSTYAVYLTTVSHWALAWDTILIYLYLETAKSWQSYSQDIGLAVLAGWMFSSKFLKLLGHYIRYPGDFLLLPVSILFGYFHGLIKGYAMLSLNVVRPNIFMLSIYLMPGCTGGKDDKGDVQPLPVAP